jgi:hypothetical protein
MADALFLDFDGVLCDSVNECFVSSWIAFHERYLGDSPTSVLIEHYAEFRHLRPFVRSGRDFMLVHDMIAQGVSPASQSEFDAVADGAGAEKMGTFDSLLYAVREELVDRQIDFWLALHKSYGSLGASLQSAAGNPQVWIVSTKRSEFIAKILAYWNIDWERDRIVLPVGMSKMEVIGAIMRDNGYSSGIFVDDQPDHLRCDPDSGLECRLAQWAYGGGNAAPADGARRISLTQLSALIDSFAA